MHQISSRLYARNEQAITWESDDDRPPATESEHSTAHDTLLRHENTPGGVLPPGSSPERDRLRASKCKHLLADGSDCHIGRVPPALTQGKRGAGVDSEQPARRSLYRIPCEATRRVNTLGHGEPERPTVQGQEDERADGCA